jgi:DNA-binding transcriptional regulator YiaG
MVVAAPVTRGGRMTTLADEVRETLTLPDPGTARAIREGARISQARLAAELGVSRVCVLRWESRQRTPRGALRTRYTRLLAELDAVVRSAGRMP